MYISKTITDQILITKIHNLRRMISLKVELQMFVAVQHYIKYFHKNRNILIQPNSIRLTNIEFTRGLEKFCFGVKL